MHRAHSVYTDLCYCLCIQTFHTMKTESGCHNTNDEEFPELETTVAAFSGGPVGPSDRYDLFNKTLIMATWYSKVF